jgi:hypothetical protein
MILNELFSTAYPHAVVTDIDTEYRSNFYDPVSLSVVSFEAKCTGLDPNKWIVNFFRGNETKNTGQGNAYKIFSTILAIMKEFIIARKPNVIMFVANQDNKNAVYARMITRFAENMGYRLAPAGKLKLFKLERIEQEVV